MEEIMSEKALFISKNKNKLINNLQMIHYLLFKILVSDKSLAELEEYNKILKYLKTKESNDEVVGNEIYLISTLASFLDRAPISFEEKKKTKQKLYRYNSYYNYEKESHIVI